MKTTSLLKRRQMREQKTGRAPHNSSRRRLRLELLETRVMLDGTGLLDPPERISVDLSSSFISGAEFDSKEWSDAVDATAKPTVLFPGGAVEITWRGETAKTYPGKWILSLDGVNGSPSEQAKAGQAILQSLSAEHVQGQEIANIQVTRNLGHDGLFQIEAPPALGYHELSSSLSRLPGFRFVEPDFALWADVAVLNDPSFPQLWGLNNTGQTGGTPDADIDAVEAWDITRGSSSIVVGVIDTGVDYTHPDLAGNIWTNPGEIGGDGVDNDGNGYIDDVHGYDFVNTDGDPFDDDSHGTHVAGTIGAVGDNGVGVVGVNWNVRIMALKFLDGDGRGWTSGAIAAVNYATMMHQRGTNIRLTNNSWGGGGFSQALKDAIEASGNEGLLFIAAAGNQSPRDNDANPHYPSSYDLDNVIAVAATDHNDGLASFSHFGATSVDLGAPGVGTLSTTPGNTYSTFSGTSMATPHVAGVAALTWSVDPSATHQQVRDAILHGVDPVPSLSNVTVTGGRLNALGALRQMGLVVIASNPPDGGIVAFPPTDFVLDFSDPFDSSSVAAGDLTVNGIAANSFTLTLGDDDTITFHFAASPVTAQGAQSMAMAAGAVTRLGDGDLLAAYNANFRYDAIPLQVTSVTPSDGSVVTLPLTTLEVNFNEAFDPNSIDAFDLTINQGSVTGFAFVDPDTVRYTLGGVTQPGALSIDIAAGAVRDIFGNPGAAYSGSLILDLESAAYPAPLVSVAPSGSLIYDQSESGTIDFSGDADTYTLALDAGQTLTVVVQPALTLRPTVTLHGPNQSVLASAAAPDAGHEAILQTIPVLTAGVYSITVTGLDASAGAFTLQVVLNSAVESEEHDGLANDTLSDAQNIDGSFVELGGAASRGAVLGHIRGSAGIISTESEPNDDGVPGASLADLPLADDWSRSFASLGGNDFRAVLGGTIRQGNDADWDFLKILSSPGDTLTVAMNGGSLSDPYLRLYDNTGALLASDDDSGPGFNSLLTFSRFAYSGDYYVVADSFSSTAGSYELIGTLTTTNPPPTPTVAEDYYAFSLESGEPTTLAVTGLNDGSLELELLDATGTVLAIGMRGATNLDAVIHNFQTPAAGTYYARVSVSGIANTDYSLLVTRSADFDAEPNDNPVSGQEIGGSHAVLGHVGGSAKTISTESAPNDDGVPGASLADLPLADDWSGSFASMSGNEYQAVLSGSISQGNDADWDFLKILASSGDTLTVAMNGGSLSDPYLRLYDRNGALLASDDDSGPGFNSLLTFSRFAYSGDYYVVADSYGSNAGSYELIGTLTTTSPMWPLDSDFYRVDISAGDRLVIGASLPGGGPAEFINLLDLAIELYDPNGDLVASDPNGSLDYAALLSGPYTLRVMGEHRTHGEYVLHTTVVPHGSVRGYVFEDVNNDGAHQPEEPPLAGWPVLLAEDGEFLYELPHSPNVQEYFGASIAAANGRVMVGAHGTRKVYVYDETTNQLIRTLDQPTIGGFGVSMAAVGNQVLVGAHSNDSSSGLAFVYDVPTGQVMHTIPNPSPSPQGDLFGAATGVMGNNFLVGAVVDSDDGYQAGAAYLFDGATGGLLRRFSSPALDPTGDQFGSSFATLGNSVFIGALDGDSAGLVGVVYMFDAATGDLIRTFNSPSGDLGQDFFGYSIAVVGGQYLLVGAAHDEVAGVSAGAAYLFDIGTGQLVQTYNTPRPTYGAFGASVAAVGESAVLIGAYGSYFQEPYVPGQAYVFDALSGRLLQVIEEPNPGQNDTFANVVASFNGKAYISDPVYGAGDLGAVFVFDLPMQSQIVSTAADGSYEFADLQAGEYHVVSRLFPGTFTTTPEMQHVTLAPGGNVTNVDFLIGNPPLPGDVNGDGLVNIFDINLISAHWGKSGPLGDANHDGIVNIFDVNVVSANWGNTSGGGGGGGASLADDDETQPAAAPAAARDADTAEETAAGGNPAISPEPRTATDQGSVLPGDLNLDGRVDATDVEVVSANWNGTGPAGDANGDGIVDIFDVNWISSHWTPIAAPPPPVAIGQGADDPTSASGASGELRLPPNQTVDLEVGSVPVQRSPSDMLRIDRSDAALRLAANVWSILPANAMGLTGDRSFGRALAWVIDDAHATTAGRDDARIGRAFSAATIETTQPESALTQRLGHRSSRTIQSAVDELFGRDDLDPFDTSVGDDMLSAVAVDLRRRRAR